MHTQLNNNTLNRIVDKEYQVDETISINPAGDLKDDTSINTHTTANSSSLTDSDLESIGTTTLQTSPNLFDPNNNICFDWDDMDKLFKNATVEKDGIVMESDCISYFTPSAFIDLKLDDSKTVFTMDQFLSSLPYQDLTGTTTEQTELENMTAQAKVYQTVINENLDNHLIHPMGDELNDISFRLHAGLSEEEREMPKFLLPKGGSILQAYNIIQWN